MADHNYKSNVRRLGIPDKIIEHGTQPELYAECKYDAAAIAQNARQMLSVNVTA